MSILAFRISLFALAAWVLYEAKVKGIRHGWVALALGVVPGVVYTMGWLKRQE